MAVFKLSSQPLEQISDPQRWAWRLGQFGAARAAQPIPVRFVVMKQRADLRAPSERLTAKLRALEPLAAAARPLLEAVAQGGDPDAILGMLPAQAQAEIARIAGGRPLDAALRAALWPHGWYSRLARFYGELQTASLWRVGHYLQAWPGRGQEGSSLAVQLQQATGRSVAPLAHLPPVIGCRYTAHATYLQPAEPGHPYLAVLLSTALRGVWDAATLHPLLDQAGVQSVLLDIQTLGQATAQRQMELAYRAARVVNRDSNALDTRAETVEGEAHAVLHALREQALHVVTVAVLVSGATREQLEAHVSEVRGVLGTELTLSRLAGTQDTALRLWSPTPTAHLDLPKLGWPVLSAGLGTMWGLLGYHQPSGTDGILWAVDALRRAPLFFDLFQDGGAAHGCVLGMTGYGKSYFLNTVTLRAALAGWKVIFLDIAENCLRMEAAMGAGCAVNLMGLDSALNLLDVVYPADAGRDWRGMQVQHVIDQLGALLGSAVTLPSGAVVTEPRRWSTRERGVLDQVLHTLYADAQPNAGPDRMPLLRNLVAALRDFHDPLYPDLAEPQQLAEELHLHLQGSLQATFDAPTSLAWDWSAPVTFFDFKETRVPANLRPFFMGQVIGAIHRYMLDPHRDRAQPTLLIVDEAGIVGTVQSVARMLAELAKRARKDRIGVLVADQNPSLFRDNPWFKTVFELSPLQVVFRLKDGPAQEMAELIPRLAPTHLRWITEAERGQAVVVVGDDVYCAQVVTSPSEHAAFAGS